MGHDFPGFRTVQRLHTSHRSIVDRVIRLADGATVIMKQPADEVLVAEAKRRVQHEFDLMRMLGGSGVVAALAIVRNGNRAALISEDLGDVLGSWIAQHRPSLAEALQIGIELARVLARMHAVGVIHKDINPNNIGYDPATGVAKLIDFDLASRGSRVGELGDSPGALPDSIEGTLHYLAPEQTGRINQMIDARSDLYALGATLYELLTGRRPFEGDDALAVVHAHLAQQPRRVDEEDPTIPAVVGDIVMKLLAKGPEQRYQTATGLQADLVRCLRELDGADREPGTPGMPPRRHAGRIAPFAIARHDAPPRLEFSDRLYGRQPEIRALLDALERTRRGATEIVLVSGYAGIGKSSVVREIEAAVTGGLGYMASGKFEQLNRDVPYSAVIVALDQLLTQILAAPTIAQWRSELAAALGADAALVRMVLPAIEQVLGPVSPEPAVDPDHARRRLARALSRVIQVFASPAHPLVVFLDDMQWADAASLQLLTQLVTSEATEALLLIEAYRDNEVGAAHPFAQALRVHEHGGATVSRIALAPLTLAETTELVADGLRLSPADIADAASVIWRKTEGNPFFIRQFVQALYAEGTIAFDPGTNAFTIDVSAIARVAITDNVADLLAHQLGKLPAVTRDALVAAAAIGVVFDLATLAVVIGGAPAELQPALALAVQAGMIVMLDGEPLTGDAGAARYRFQHDRIQQAAYEAAPRDPRDRLHLTIGRRLLASATPGELDLRLFEIVHHLALGARWIDDEPERARFVELAVVTAQRARRSGAVDVAATILRAAATACEPQAHHAAWFAVHVALAEALSIGGAHLAARDVIAKVAPHASHREQATLAALEMTICTGLGRVTEALRYARRAAALFGIELPHDPAEIHRQIGAEIGAIMAARAQGPIEAWLELPVMTDPDQLAIMALLVHCLAAAHQSEPALGALISAKLVGLSLRHGNCGASASGYSSLAFALWMMHDYDAAFRIGKLGVDVAHRLDARELAPGAAFLYAIFASSWQRPLKEGLEQARGVIASAVEVGDLATAGYAALFAIDLALIQSEPLDELIAEAQRYRTLCGRLGLREIEAALTWRIAHARTWTDEPAGRGEHDRGLAETDQAFAATGSRSLLAVSRILELERRYWAGDLVGALEVSRTIVPLLDAVPANVHNAEYCFYFCLAAIAVGGEPDELAVRRAELARYATACPANFGHMSAVVEAELARERGDIASVLALQDVALEGAAQHGFVKVEVVAHELAARLWIARGQPAFAAVHLGKARDLCEHWGARPRARVLELRRRQLGAATDSTMHSSSRHGSTLDFATIVKASQAIASDVVLDSLLVKMIEIIIENAGAQGGSIVLEIDGVLAVHVSKPPGAKVAVAGGPLLADAREVSEGIIKYVMRTAECVVLGDATRHPTFRTDPYVRERRPRSVLCLPIAHKDRVLGAVYLENNLVPDAFAVERLDAIGILVAQLAISIENALVFSRLEDLVSIRTQALTELNHQLREQSRVRARMESELRLGQKLQSVGQLAAGIAHEINTPMQYIGDNLAFLREALDSLFGVIDAYRAAVDPVTARVDLAAMDRADEELELAYLRANASIASSAACDGVRRVSQIVIAMRAFSHPDRPDQTATALAAALETTLVVAQNAYRDVADVVTDFAVLPEIMCHPGELNQVFLNLIVNAAHAIEDVVRSGGRRGTITITTRREADDVVLITVGDTGGGIPEAIRDRVFDPFFTTKEVGRGTGQGLALTRAAVVDRHGGTVEFETQAGVGTTFSIRLPMRGRNPTPPSADVGAAAPVA